MHSHLLIFLDWVAAQPRSYAQAMDAWRTSCPRLSAWEDALDAGLIEVDPRAATCQGDAAVRLTPAGAAAREARP